MRNASEEGVVFLFNRQPLEIVGGDAVSGVKVVAESYWETFERTLDEDYLPETVEVYVR